MTNSSLQATQGIEAIAGGGANRGDAAHTDPLSRSILGKPRFFESFGVRFSVRTAEPWVLEGVRRYLPLPSQEVSAGDLPAPVSYAVRQTVDGFYWQLLKGARVILQTRSLPRALETLRGKLVEHVGRLNQQFTWVHAGVVGWKERAILLPGRSFAGKSTLVAELIKAGASYYSDELAMLDERGFVHAYPRPLTLRHTVHVDDEAEALARRRQMQLPPLPVAAVVFACYTADASWKVRPLTPGQAVAEGLRYSFGVRQAPASTLRAWSRALEGTLSWGWERGEAAEAAALLLAALAAGQPPPRHALL